MDRRPLGVARLRLRRHHGRRVEHLQYAANVPDLRDQIPRPREGDARASPQLPEEARAVTVLMEGMLWAAVGVDPQDLSVSGTIQSRSPEAARAMHELLTKVAMRLRQALTARLGVELPEEAARAAVPEVRGDRLELELDAGKALAAMALKMYRRQPNIDQLRAVTRLRRVHQAAFTWAQVHGSRLPSDLATLVHDKQLNPDLLLSPLDRTSVPEDFEQWPQERQTRWLNANTSFIYIPGRNDDADPKAIVLVEKPPLAIDGKVAAVFGDNHAEAIPRERASQILREQTGFTLEQWAQVTAGRTPAETGAAE